MAGTVSNNDCVGWGHWHWTHTDRYLVITSLVDSDVSLGHLGYHHVLHDWAEFRGQVWIQLAHRNLANCRRLADVAHDYLFVSKLVVNLTWVGLHYYLALTYSLVLLTWVRRLLASCLGILILRLLALSYLLSLSSIVIKNHKWWVNRIWIGCSWILQVVVLMSLTAWGSILLASLGGQWWLVARDDHCTWLIGNIGIEAGVASALKSNLVGWLVVLVLLLRLVVVWRQVDHDWRWLLHLLSLLCRIWTYAGRNLVGLVHNLLV